MASTLKVNTIQHTGGTTGMTIDSSGRIKIPNIINFNVTGNGAWVDHGATATVYFKTSKYHNVLNNSNKFRFILSISIVEEGEEFKDAEGNHFLVDDKYLNSI